MGGGHRREDRGGLGLATIALTLLALQGLLTTGCGAPEPPPAEEVAQEAAAAGLENGSFMVELEGVPIHYEVHGSGPVVMTVPNSWGLTLDGLRLLYRPLEEHLTLVYFDPRGMGESGPVREDADMGMAAVRADFDALRRHLGLEKVHALGWSNGAMNLMLLAAEKPETLSSAIFVHGAAHFGEEDQQALAERFPELFKSYAELQQELSGDLPLAEKDARLRTFYLDGWFPLMFAEPEKWRPRVGELYREVGFSWRHSAFTNAEPPFDARDRLASITVPSLVVAGAHDMMPPERVEEVAQGIPDARFQVFESSGHFAPLEEPEAFQRAVLGFLGAE